MKKMASFKIEMGTQVCPRCGGTVRTILTCPCCGTSFCGEDLHSAFAENGNVGICPECNGHSTFDNPPLVHAA
uniref:Uncharacterized protein n=1 Tax=Candidatus Giovannonibacteria bacterium GW2011_GWF2_42_19 TaxID=1618659 RepID=A0A0G0ZF88_9BACT|nr:MAG: hypothetical protein UV11_C0016G0002 [Candidatus Giovannonibacteria bacterium GW2011_GWF2_42_19]